MKLHGQRMMLNFFQLKADPVSFEADFFQQNTDTVRVRPIRSMSVSAFAVSALALLCLLFVFALQCLLAILSLSPRLF